MAPKVAHLGGFMAETCVEIFRDFFTKGPSPQCVDRAAPVLLVPVWYWDVVKTGALALVKLQFLYMPILACPWSLAPGAGLFLEGINVLILPGCYCKQSGSP